MHLQIFKASILIRSSILSYSRQDMKVLPTVTILKVVQDRMYDNLCGINAFILFFFILLRGMLRMRTTESGVDTWDRPGDTGALPEA